MNREAVEFPDRVKLVLATIAAVMFLAALGTPIERVPAVPDDASAQRAASLPTASHESMAPVDAVAEPHVQAF